MGAVVSATAAFPRWLSREMRVEPTESPRSGGLDGSRSDSSQVFPAPTLTWASPVIRFAM